MIDAFDPARAFPNEPGEFGAFAEGRYFAWEKVEAEQHFPVKGHSLNAAQILGSAERARLFEGGPVLLVRLPRLITLTHTIPTMERL